MHTFFGLSVGIAFGLVPFAPVSATFIFILASFGFAWSKGA